MNAPMDPKQKKDAVPLKASVPAVRSARVPATKTRREYYDFDQLVHVAEVLGLHARDLLDSSSGIANEVVRSNVDAFLAELAIYERAEFYRRSKRRVDLMTRERHQQITRRFVVERVALLIGGFPNANPHCPELYAQAVVEEILAANPRVVELESACREIRRTWKWPPAIPELLAILLEHMRQWNGRCEMIGRLKAHLAQER